MRLLARHFVRRYAVGTPRIRPNPFSRPLNVPLTEISPTTYPNPLFSMTKDRIMELLESELSHLLAIPYRNVAETDDFCQNMVDIIYDQLLSDSSYAAKCCGQVSSHDVKAAVFEALQTRCASDTVRKSILSYILGPGPDFRKSFFTSIAYITTVADKLADIRCNMLLSYLRALAKTGRINENPLLLADRLYDSVLLLIPRDRYAELYSYFLHLNIQANHIKRQDGIKRALLEGSNTEKFVVRTGWMDPRWHDVRRYDFDALHRQRMELFFSVRDLKTFVLHAVKQSDVVDADLYLDLLVSKFENKSLSLETRLGDSLVEEDVQTVLHVILNHIMVFKGLQSCIKVLRYMVKNHLEVHFGTLLLVLSNLRQHGHFAEALLLVNHMDLLSLENGQKRQLVHEVVYLIHGKFPDSPKVLLGYISAIFNKVAASSYADTSQNTVPQLLADLRILETVYRTKDGLSKVEKANIDELLTGFELSHSALECLYESVLRLQPTSTTPAFIQGLYEAYILQKEAFSDLNDHIITLFAKFLLKENPMESDMDLVASTASYLAACKIVDDFLLRTDLKRATSSVYLFDLMISAGLLQHNDYAYASKMIRESRKLGLPFTFNQIYPFIMYHYQRGEYSQAERWYNEITRHGVKTTSRPAKDLFKIARELNWSINGFVYRKFGIYKNYKAREELLRLHRDPILMVETKEDLEDAVTEDLIAPAGPADVNLGEELAKVLHEIGQQKRRMRRDESAEKR